MAKPINPYQGPAPEVMKYMGQGLMEAGAHAARIMQSGSESMAKGITGGINTAIDEYSKYKDTQSQIKASEKSYETLKSYLPKDVRKQFDTQIQSLNQDINASLRDKAAFWDQAKGFIGSAVGQSFAMQKAQQEQTAAMERTLVGEAGATGRKRLDLQAEAEKLGGPALPSEGGPVLPGAHFYDQGFAQPKPQPASPFGPSLKKKHFGMQ